LTQVIGWLLLTLAAVALSTGLIVGSSSRTTSLLLLGLLLIAITFALSQRALNMIAFV